MRFVSKDDDYLKKTFFQIFYIFRRCSSSLSFLLFFLPWNHYYDFFFNLNYIILLLLLPSLLFEQPHHNQYIYALIMKNKIILINGWKIDNEDVLRAKYFHYIFIFLSAFVCVLCMSWLNGGKWLLWFEFHKYIFRYTSTQNIWLSSFRMKAVEFYEVKICGDKFCANSRFVLRIDSNRQTVPF